MLITSIVEHIGNTPLLLIPEEVHEITGLEIYAKLEYLNPFGSVKDRTALGILKESGDKDIIESSSGNTAKALGILAGLQGKKCISVTNRIKQKEVEDILRLIGVDIRSLPPGSECPDPNDPNSPFQTIQSIIAKHPDTYYWTDQYTNIANPNIHTETTAREIDRDIGTPDYFFAGLGTTGSSRGISQYFATRGDMQSIGIITASGSYIPGIRNNREMNEVGLFNKKYYTEYIEVNDKDAITDTLTLIRTCGMLVGPTTGAIYHGMIEYLQKQDPNSMQGKKVVFIACDGIESYTSYMRAKMPDIFGEKIDTPSIDTLGKSNIVDIIPDETSNHLVIDMRSYESYKIGHINGSLSFPFEELQRYTKQGYLPFPREKSIIFVCPYGEESILMSQIADSLGYIGASLENGYLKYKKKYPDSIISQYNKNII